MAALEGSILRVGIDVGGTFTDLVAMDARTGERIVIKCASTPRAPERGVLAAIDRLPPCTIEYLAHSTTIATNALLGQMHLELPRIAFITTAGFRDVIEIGRQNRSEVYNLFVTRPKPLVAREDRLGVNERIDFNGNVLVALEQKEIDRIVGQLRERDVAAVAIGLLHSYVNDAHELRLQQAIESALPGVPVTRSSAIDPEYREYERFSTAVVNAALLPIIQRYVDRLSAALHERGIEAPLYVMQSNGGMASADRAAMRPASIIESGPASGVIGAADLARTVGVARVLSFDMGGTTAKTGTIVDGIVQVATEFEAAGTTHSGRSVKGSGYPVRFPFVDLAEISAGGGTIAHVDDPSTGSGQAALRVGPLSAGADPGPACYGRSDRATVTDANVVLGRLNREALVGGTFPIDAHRSYEAIRKLAERIGLSTEETAAGIVRIVDAQMAKVLRIVTVERGLDPRDFTMVAFGGNGPLHGCALAEELGMRRVIIPEHPGVFSAHGLLVADLRASFVRPVLREASEAADDSLRETFEVLEREARDLLEQQGARDGSIAFRREYDMRYRGQSFELDVEHTPSARIAAERFHDKHKRRYGYAVPGEPVEIVNARLSATAPAAREKASTALGRAATTQRDTPALVAERNVWIEGEYVETQVYARETLPPNAAIDGPALIEQYDTCTYVAPGWSAKNDGTVLLVEKR